MAGTLKGMRTAILLSGGIDSTALAFWLRPSVAITVDYGQASALGEIRAATQIAKELGLHHEIIRVDCRALGTGDLVGELPARDAPAPEWWPYRNQLLITLSASRAYTLGVTEIIAGSVRGDAFHADGTKMFYDAASHLLSLQEGGIRVTAPALNLTAIDLVRTAKVPPNLLGWTHSCHKASFACGQCRGCNKHREVMEALTL